MSQTFTFYHDQLLAPETSLLLDEQQSTISLWQAGERICQQRFTEQEYRLLHLFFSRGTAIHCRYDEALAVLLQEPVGVCTTSLQVAQSRDEYEELPRYYFLATMKPVITTLEGCQLRLHRLGLRMCALVDYGYVLVSHPLHTHATGEVL